MILQISAVIHTLVFSALLSLPGPLTVESSLLSLFEQLCWSSLLALLIHCPMSYVVTGTLAEIVVSKFSRTVDC